MTFRSQEVGNYRHTHTHTHIWTDTQNTAINIIDLLESTEVMNNLIKVAPRFVCANYLRHPYENFHICS